MSVLRKISSFAATTLVAVAPLCVGFYSAPLASASPNDTPATSTSSPTQATKTQNLSDWAKANCPGGAEFVNQTNENTPIYLGYANGNTYLGYTDAKKTSMAKEGKKFVDPRTDAKYQEKFGTCVRVADDLSGQASAQVFYGTLFKADKSSLSASGFSQKTQTVFQVTKVVTWVPDTKVESRTRKTSGNYQEMPYSVSKGKSDSGFKNLSPSFETSIDLRFSQSGFYTVYIKAITTDPQNPDKSYQAEMAYTFIVGKEAAVPQDLQDIVDGNTGEEPGTTPTPNPGETTPDTPTPNPGHEGGDTKPGTEPGTNPTPGTPTPGQGGEGTDSKPGTQPGTTPTPNPGKTTPGTEKPGPGNKGGNSQPGTNPTPGTQKPGQGNQGGDSQPGTNPSPGPAVTPYPRTPTHGDKGGTSHPGTTPAPRAGDAAVAPMQSHTAPSRTQLHSAAGSLTGNRATASGAAPLLPQLPNDILPSLSQLQSLDNLGADNPPATNPELDSPSQQGTGGSQESNSALKFQAANSSTDVASRQWIRSSSMAVFAGGTAIAGFTGVGLLVFSRLNP